MLRRTYLGLDLATPALHAVALRRQGRGIRVVGGRASVLPEGLLSLSSRSPAILDRSRFQRLVQELLNPLAGAEDRVALALPDKLGRILLTETETDFRTRAEGLEILRWQLRNSLPAEAKGFHLDFQSLGRTEAGSQRLIVAAIPLDVLREYEEALQDAGYQAAHIGFHSLALYQACRQRLDLEENGVFVGIEGGRVTLIFLADRVPVFYRVRDVEPDPARIFHEVSRTLAGLRGSGGISRRGPVYLHLAGDQPADIVAALAGAFERDVHLLEPRTEAAPLGGDRQTSLAALGAAEWMLQR